VGARLVGEVLARWAPVTSDRGFRILVRMAHTALDESNDGRPAGLYFGGRDLLVATLREESRRGKPENVYKEVRTIIAELIRIGAIERTNHARSGSNAVYRLTLSGRPRIDATVVDNAVAQAGQAGSTTPPQEGRTTPPQEGSQTPFRRGPQPLPRNHEEPVEEKSQEKAADLRGPLTLPRAHETETELQFIPPPQCGHPGCSRGFVLPTDPRDPVTQCPRCNSNVIPFPERTSA